MILMWIYWQMNSLLTYTMKFSCINTVMAAENMLRKFENILWKNIL